MQVMSKVVLWVLMSTMCWAATGCLGLIRTILYPVETAQAVASRVTYDIASELSGAQEQLITSADSLDSINQIIEDHPDAANKDSLIRLRNQLQDQASAGERTTNSLDVVPEGEKRFASDFTPHQRENEFDRHKIVDAGLTDSRLVHKPSQSRRNMVSHLDLEHPSQPYLPLRDVDGRHFETVPDASDLPKPEPDYPIMHMRGNHIMQTGLKKGTVRRTRSGG